MDLPAKLLEEIIWGAAEAQQPSPRDRRHATRLALTGPVLVRLAAEASSRPSAECRLRDVSTMGIGLTCPMAIELYQRILVTLPRRGARSITLQCIVTRCTPADATSFNIGATFDSVADKQDQT